MVGGFVIGGTLDTLGEPEKFCFFLTEVLPLMEIPFMETEVLPFMDILANTMYNLGTYHPP